MKINKDLSDEQLAAFLDAVMQGKESCDSISDIDTLEVLSVAKSSLSEDNEEVFVLPPWSEITPNNSKVMPLHTPLVKAGFLGENNTEDDTIDEE